MNYIKAGMNSRDLCHIFQGFGRIVPVLLLALAVLTGGCSKKDEKKPSAAVPVKTATVIQKDIPVEVTANGTVEAYSVVNVTSRVDGQVMQVHLKEGQEVQKGQLLFNIDERPYQAMLEEAQSNLERDRVNFEMAEKDAKRYADLLTKDYVTKSDAEQAQTNAESLKAVVKADEAALESARLNLAYCRIFSPITGRAGAILINEGNLVKAGDTNPLMVINQVQPIFVGFSVPEQFLPEIQHQMAIQPLKVLAAAPEKQHENREGRLTFVDNTINPSTGTISLKATFENRDNGLWPGQFLNVVLVLGMRSGAIVVPSAAVQMGQQGEYVFVVKNDLTVESRNVTAGPRINDETVIEKGLSAGETVVTDGQLRLFPGAKVVLKNDEQSGGEARQ